MEDPTHDPASETRYPGAPRWAKVLGVIIALLIVLVILLQVFGGEHGPRRHFGGSSAEAPAASPLEGGRGG